MAKNKIIIKTDGGARGNPGPAAIGVVIELSDGSKSKGYGEQIGNTTNNIAEYKAVVFGLKKAKQLFGKIREGADVEVRSDSELLVNQLNGKYYVKNEDLFPLFINIWNLKQDFGSVEFKHVRREENKEADRLVNRALDTLGI
ncbi:MAG TPA: ribonuclease HI family protein [Candidatus Paceibacterota bacterium]